MRIHPILRTLLIPCLLAGAMMRAQEPEAPEPAKQEQPLLTMFPHTDTARWFLAGQANIIFQAHPGFHSPYSGTNSMLARGEYKTSMVGTLYMGYELNANPRYDTD